MAFYFVKNQFNELRIIVPLCDKGNKNPTIPAFTLKIIEKNIFKIGTKKYKRIKLALDLDRIQLNTPIASREYFFPDLFGGSIEAQSLRLNEEQDFELSSTFDLNYYVFDPNNVEDIKTIEKMKEIEPYFIDSYVLEQLMPKASFAIEALDKKTLVDIVSIQKALPFYSQEEQLTIIRNYISTPLMNYELKYKFFCFKDRTQEALKSYFWAPRSMIEVLIEGFFSYVLGFQWFISWTSGHYLCTLIDELPIYLSLDYEYPNYEYILDDYYGYELNLINFWAFIINIPLRFIGKILGVILSFIITAPIYLGIKLFYQVKDFLAEKELDNFVASRKIQPEELVFTFLKGGFYFKEKMRLAHSLSRHIDFFDFINAAIPLINALTPWSKDESYKYRKRIHKYRIARESLIKQDINLSLALTIILAILFIPTLALTLPWHLNKKNEYKEELELLEDIKDFDLGKPEDLYPIGEQLLNKGKASYACSFFSSVRPDDKNYTASRFECSHFYRALGDYDNAMPYATEAEDEELITSLEERMIACT